MGFGLGALKQGFAGALAQLNRRLRTLYIGLRLHITKGQGLLCNYARPKGYGAITAVGLDMGAPD